MTDDPRGGLAPEPVPPRPVPGSVPAAAPGPGDSPVTDGDRQRYGRLLDNALERGLLGSHEYEVRLRALAAAGTLEEMTRIVTDLPAFAAAAPGLPGTAFPLRPAVVPATARSASGRRRSNPWVMLAVMLLVVAAAFAVLLVYAEHLVHARPGGAVVVGAPPPGARPAP